MPTRNKKRKSGNKTHVPYINIIKKEMEQNLIYTICGYVASLGLILGFLPQAITTIRTRNTEGISVPAFLLMGIGAFAFVLQGLVHQPNVIWSMVITNAVTCTCSIIVFAIKIHNDSISSKPRKQKGREQP